MKTEDCSSDDFLLSVCDIFVENSLTASKSKNMKASAERWTTNSVFRGRLFKRVKARYCERTGCEPWCFWFSEDGVAEAYLRWRKCGDDDDRKSEYDGIAMKPGSYDETVKHYRDLHGLTEQAKKQAALC